MYYPGNTPGGQDSQGYTHGSLKQYKNQRTNQPTIQPGSQPANQPTNQPTEKQTLEDGGGWFTQDTREDGYSSASGSSGWEGPREESGQELLKCPTSGRRRFEHLPVPHSRILLSFPRKTACETSLNGRAAKARPEPQSWILDPQSPTLDPRHQRLDGSWSRGRVSAKVPPPACALCRPISDAPAQARLPRSSPSLGPQRSIAEDVVWRSLCGWRDGGRDRETEDGGGA